jgi:hypothetical protein
LLTDFVCLCFHNVIDGHVSHATRQCSTTRAKRRSQVEVGKKGEGVWCYLTKRAMRSRLYFGFLLSLFSPTHSACMLLASACFQIISYHTSPLQPLVTIILVVSYLERRKKRLESDCIHSTARSKKVGVPRCAHRHLRDKKQKEGHGKWEVFSSYYSQMFMELYTLFLSPVVTPVVIIHKTEKAEIINCILTYDHHHLVQMFMERSSSGRLR